MAVSSRDRRIAKELQDIQADRDNSGVYATSASDDSLSKLVGTIPGPPDTPYEGGRYEIEITVPDTYPFKSPAMKFKTKVWHPNISSATGAICLDTLGKQWSPVQTIKTALLSLRLLLECPNPSDPQDAQVAQEMINAPRQWAQKAQEWAVQYAGAPRRELDLSKYAENGAGIAAPDMAQYKGYNPQIVHRFVDMGFPVELVVRCLKKEKIPERIGDEGYPMTEGMSAAIFERIMMEQDD